MQAHNGTAETNHRTLEAQIDAVKSNLKHLLDRLEGKSEHMPRTKAFASRMTQAIKAHPIRSIAVALGLGYVVTRIARR